ncbi:ligand-binding SRPBCC domain-containing protein [Streptomyces canus]|uniref:SRPBCC family protein n=1 Tax=Streptomyces canus TaxID=58343 RepID=UPI00278AF48C|nr:SRPBCC family protein [Streptomyces canus]MDQ0595782.1 ligand-binding SRPBCC domain-containing protein [Streptomyces canus]
MNTYVVTEQAVINAPLGRVWDVISRTDRYAEWVAGAIEVTDHHGVATVGRTYAERNRTLGPLKTDSVWTVREIEPCKRRVDTGTGFAPLRNVTSVFEFRPLQSGDGRETTEMIYQVEYTIGLGPLGDLLNRVQEPSMRSAMRTSMTNLDRLLRSESSTTAR